MSKEPGAERRAHAQASWPHEACGLLIGQGRDVVEVIPCDNISETPENSFEIDPQAIITAQKKLRGSAQKIIGHYHSHPDGTAWPSARDRERIYDPTLIWAILSVREGRVVDENFFEIKDGDFLRIDGQI